MRILVHKAVQVSIEPTAAVDLPAALATIGRQVTGQIDQNSKLLELKGIASYGSIEQYSGFRHNGVRWVCPVVFEFLAMVYALGEVYLFTAEAAEARPTFVNAHCSATITHENLAASYTAGDLIPMVVREYNSIRGQPRFSACVHPWTASDARAPSFSRGPVTPAEVGGFPALADLLEAATAAATAARPREVMGLAAPPPPAAKPIADLLRDMHKAAQTGKLELPLQTLTPHPGWGALAVTAVAGGAAAASAASAASWDIPAAAAVERPAIALASAAYRELALLEVLRELAELHAERLVRGAQDRVWQIAAQSRGFDTKA
jgi:hypothetical protein